MDGYTLYNGRLTLTAPDKSSTIALYGENLTNEKYFQYLGSEDYVAGKYSTGRRYMLTLRAGF